MLLLNNFSKESSPPNHMIYWPAWARIFSSHKPRGDRNYARLYGTESQIWLVHDNCLLEKVAQHTSISYTVQKFVSFLRFLPSLTQPSLMFHGPNSMLIYVISYSNSTKLTFDNPVVVETQGLSVFVRSNKVIYLRFQIVCVSEPLRMLLILPSASFCRFHETYLKEIQYHTKNLFLALTFVVRIHSLGNWETSWCELSTKSLRWDAVQTLKASKIQFFKHKLNFISTG